ncbi:hypothetical protein CK227_10475 [Mesorhizobium sp. WSM4308]|uniref:hypothetical protein n=1 Tax=Mesorhizobium sp. WSM4308 TaxID=2029409 RepID=UPI000BAF8EDE|nr:hypothetical protein [Mesorhizobium sp. WSM4308]PBB75208.1 hypothetical protein CK227_10475 [Mesorhizobium sp. WSM4308]
MMIVDPYRFAGSSPVGCAYQGFTDDTAGGVGTTRTVPGCPIGTAIVGRHVFAWLFWSNTAATATLLSATIGGVAAVIHVQKVFASIGTNAGFALISAPLAVGTTATFVLNYSDVAYPRIHTYRVTDLISNTAFASQSNGGSSSTQSLNASCNTQAGGVVFFAMNAGWAPLTVTLTGSSQDFMSAYGPSSNLISGGFFLTAVAETPRAFNSTLTGAVVGAPNHANLVASFR